MVPTVKSNEPGETPNKKKTALEVIFGDMFATKKPEKGSASISDRAEEEMTRYKSDPPIPTASDPLQWWCQHQQNYPMLSKLAKRYLAIPGTSVPSEWVFSTAGDIVSSQREALRSDNVDKLIKEKDGLSLVSTSE